MRLSFEPANLTFILSIQKRATLSWVETSMLSRLETNLLRGLSMLLRKSLFFLAVLWMVALVITVGCGSDLACGDGTTEKDGKCVPSASGAEATTNGRFGTAAFVRTDHATSRAANAGTDGGAGRAPQMLSHH